MNDMSGVIIPKSDQLNSDSLMTGPITIKITSVEIRPGTEQPVSIFFDGDDGKPWKCCKSMARVLVAAWGADANKYVGRSLTLYRDPKVKWGGMEVGGIRISHMTDIERDMVLALTATKGKREPFKVRPLETPAPDAAPAAADKITNGVRDLVRLIKDAATPAEVDAIASDPAVIKQRTWLAKNRSAMAAQVDDAFAAARQSDADDDPFADQPSTAPARSPDLAVAADTSTPAERTEATGNEDHLPARADSGMGEQSAPLVRALHLIAVAASPAECSEICDDYIAEMSDEDYATLSKAANERGRVLMGKAG